MSIIHWQRMGPLWRSGTFGIKKAATQMVTDLVKGFSPGYLRKSDRCSSTAWTSSFRSMR